jgi:16S rRNA (cytosine1402-N4)-methyltransferase
MSAEGSEGGAEGLPDGGPRPARRPRYRGSHPRRFEEKYKERDAARHPETVAKVLASGKTPAGTHVPVMVEECLEALRLRPGQRGADVTLGHGGHALRILERILPGGCLLGLDQDPRELPRSEARLRQAGHGEDVFRALRSNYAGLPKAMAALGWESLDFVLADLGCSSMQLDDPARGFSFKREGPLDMRMNPERGLPAGEWLARVTPVELERVLREHADEPDAAKLAQALAGGRWESTLALAAAVRRAAAGGWGGEEAVESTVRRVFQALRIAVNDEFAALDAFLACLPHCLAAGARVAVLTFHSGEDRRVKQAFKRGRAEGLYAAVSEGVTVASPDERRANPRSIPAKLRWAEKA